MTNSRLHMLTDGQAARMAVHADEWIRIALQTGAADRAGFEAAARQCYAHAGIPWPERVIWTTSPLALSVAAPLAALALELQRRFTGSGAGGDAASDFTHTDPGRLAGAAGEALRGGVSELISGSVRSPVGSALRSAVGADVGREVYSGVSASVGMAAGWPVGAIVRRAVRSGIEGAVPGSVGAAVRAAVHEAAGDGAMAGAVIDAALSSRESGAMQAAIHRAAVEVIEKGWYRYIAGQLWVEGWSWWNPDFTSFLRDVCRVELRGQLWDRARAYEQTVRSACWWYPHRQFVMVSERPAGLHREPAQGLVSHRLHRTDGPAVAWPDGWGAYVVHGRRVPAWIIEEPGRLTVPDIEREINVEVRRVMIELYGWERYIRDCNAQVVDEVPADHPTSGLRGARLLRKVLLGEPEPIVYLEMRNSTPEADGTYRRYLERIDPKAYGGAAGRSCHAAMASRWWYRDETGARRRTFERWEDYKTLQES